MNLLRHAVSKQKRRYVDKESGLDLDLAYITPAIIAMGYPSRSLEAFYRNPMSDVEKFLDSRHEDRYKVYNLCSERSYSDQRFHSRVAQFPFPDHSPPPFQLIHPFCEDVSDWLHTQHDHVVAVHCKAGKGRTGVMICSYLVHCGATAAEAIQWYGDKRTMDGCGVTIPSQLRYIRYYEEFLEARTLHYDPRLLLLQEIVIDTIPKPLQRLESGNNYVILTIFSNETKIYESLPGNSRVDTKKQQIRVQFPDKIVLAGDVKIMLWYDSAYKRCHLCHYFFNTTFISKDNLLSLTKNETDKACKDKLHATFDREFKIHTRFAPAFANQSPLHTLPAEATQSILLRYKNHQGPNNIQVRPPSFSTMRLTQRSRNSPWLQIFLQDQGNDTATDPKESAADTDVAKAISTTTTNNNNNINSNNTGISTSHPPVLQTKSPPTLVQQNGSVFAPKPSISAFRPSWADKDRDRGGVDDDWDTASVSSDCSESDTATEWWYTRPPQVIFGGAIAAVGGGMSGGAGGGGGHGHGHGVNGGVAGGHYQNNGKTKSPLSSPPNSRGRIIMDGSTAAGSGGSGGPTSPLAATFSPPSGPSSSSTHVPASSVLQRNEQAPLLSVSRGNLSGAMGPAAGKLHANMVDGGGSAGTSSSSSVLALLAPSILSSASASTTSSSLPPPPPPPSSSSSVPGQQQHYLPILHYQPPPSPLANEIVIEAASSSSTREHSTLSEGGVNFATNGTPGDGDEHGGRGAGSGSGSSSSSSSQQGVNSGLPIASWFMSTSLHTLSGVAGGSGSSVYSEQTNGSSPSTGRSEGDAGVGWVDTMSRWLWPSVSTTSVNEEDAVGPV